ncbi:hypothetical protein ACFQHW_06550 [Lapidilactobacillus achengensis]|uniref:Bacterial transcription activator effector binding domain-containing protein n=1 Tax=Lapidilactobacillus achengensis TaxID=2486000 RepID=A0ABW1UMR9_9LACO|nr:hypothetical protein [Lapidilactobacillus achengensis]
MSEPVPLWTMTVQPRPVRKLLYLPAKTAHDYFSYCAEMGCDWEDFLDQIPEKFDTAALVTLPQRLNQPGRAIVAAGIEVPEDFDQPLPGHYQSAILPACSLVYFQSAPYVQESEFAQAIATVNQALATYVPAKFGYRHADQIAPRFNFGATPQTGARLAIPVLPL